MHYITWALLGMVGYSTVTLLVKLATRTGDLHPFAVLAIATSIVAVSAIANAVFGGFFIGKTAADFARPSALYSYATGVALAIAVGSLFKALSQGPAGIVVPIYGMFIVGGALLGIVVLGEPLTFRRLIGLSLSAIAVFLVAS